MHAQAVNSPCLKFSSVFLVCRCLLALILAFHFGAVSCCFLLVLEWGAPNTHSPSFSISIYTPYTNLNLQIQYRSNLQIEYTCIHFMECTCPLRVGIILSYNVRKVDDFIVQIISCWLDISFTYPFAFISVPRNTLSRMQTVVTFVPDILPDKSDQLNAEMVLDNLVSVLPTLSYLKDKYWSETLGVLRTWICVTDPFF